MQRINFFSPTLLPKREWLDFRRTLMTIPLAVIVLLMLAYWQRSVLQQEREVTAQARTELQSVLDQIADMSSKLPASKAPVSVEQLQQQLDERRAFLSSLQTDNLTQQGFSQLLMQLADTVAPTIWLTQITVDKNSLQLKGATLKPEQIPDWLLKLQQQDVRSTLQFGQLKLQRVEDKPVLQFDVTGQWQ